MAFLQEWVRGLVMLVLLASCLELLLPMNGMKRFVRMSMGLLVVLAVTRPIFGLLGQSVKVEPRLFESEADKALPTVGEIVAAGEQFRTKSRALAAAELQSRLAAEAEAVAKGVKGVQSVRAEVNVTPAGDDYRIAGVMLEIASGTAGAGMGMEPVRPVEPVRAEGGGPGGDLWAGRAETPAVSRGEAPLTEAERALADAVRQEVAARLGLGADAGLIQVRVDRKELPERR